MWNDDVGFPKDQIAQTKGTGATRTRDFEIFAAAHCKEETEKVILLEGHQEGAGRGTGAHAKDLVNRDAFLVASSTIKIFVTSVQAQQEKGLGTRGI